MSNRRLGTRNRFEMKKNYIIPLICLIITCIVIVASTIIITNLSKENMYYKAKLAETGFDTDVIVTDNAKLSNDNKIQINKLITYLMSNLNSSLNLNSEQAKYEIVCKYYAKDNELSEIPEEYINDLEEQVYRDIGYIFFDDYKDKYLYISKKDYDEAYKKLFSMDMQNINEMDKYYIKQLDAYVVPKDNQTNENSLYKVTEFMQDVTNKNIYKVKLSEINLYKLYEQKSYEDIQEYFENEIVDNDYLTGQTLNIKMIKQDGVFVFHSYINQ